MEISASHALVIHSHPAAQSQGAGAGANEALQDPSHDPSTRSANAAVSATGASESAGGKETAQDESGSGKESGSSNGVQLNEVELKQVEQLSKRDLEVRQHEQAHAAVGGAYAGAPEYEYTRGPDGRMYATGGEVSIDTAEVPGDPQATIEKMQVVIAAATAPAEPSTQDRRVAAAAQAMMAEAQAELLKSQGSEAEETDAEGEVEGEGSEASGEGHEGSRAAAKDAADTQGNGAQSQDSLLASEQADNRNQIRQLEQRLVDSGAFSQLFPAGSLISQIT